MIHMCFYFYLNIFGFAPVTKEGIRECVAGNAAIQANKKYTAQGEAQAIHYSLDAQGRVYAMVTNPTYSARVAFIALEDLQKRFGNDFGPKVASSTEESLSKAARPLLKEVVERFASFFISCESKL